MEHDVLTFGEWLAQYRQGLHLQRTELAARIGCAVVTLRKIETDERRPSRDLAELLADQLSIPPQQREVFVRVARGELPVGRLVVSGPGAEVPSNLRYPTTSLVGREREVEDVQAMLLRPEVRLLTLTGPPGVGKTRLAMEVASRLQAGFADGLFYVPLAPLQEPGLVLDTIAHALQLGTSRGQPLVERLGRYLRTRSVLLVLDSFERLVPAAPKLTQLLIGAPHLKMLVTSRVALELSGEHRFMLLPLSVPPAATPGRPRVTVEQARERYPALDLFIQRERAINPGMVMTEADLQAIGEICRRLDGLPLAIELAAARSALFTPKEILAQLDDRFTLLAGGPRDLPERHATLWRAIDWSYDLLSPAHQQLFRRLSVFAGGCTLQAAQEVCNCGGEEAPEVAEGITTLVVGNLLQRETGYDGRSRFSMLGIVREYARGKLVSSGEAGTIRQRHTDYYLHMAEAAEQAWDSPGEWDWLRRLMPERENMRAVLRRVIEEGDAETALRLNGALFSFWTICSVLSEARRWLDGALGLPLPANPSAGLLSSRAKALNVAGYLAASTADHTRAYSYFGQGLELYRGLGDRRATAWSVRGCAFAHMLHDEYAEAEQLYTESLQLCESSGDAWGLAWSRYGLAFLKLASGDLSQARSSLEGALAHLQQQDIPLGVFRALVGLGYTLLEQGDLAGAESMYREGLLLARETPMLTFITTAVEGLGMVAAYTREPERAVRLWGAAEAMREVTDEQRWHVFQRAYERALSTARALLSEEEWEQEWTAGRGLTAALATAEALRDPGSTHISNERTPFAGSLSL